MPCDPIASARRQNLPAKEPYQISALLDSITVDLAQARCGKVQIEAASDFGQTIRFFDVRTGEDICHFEPQNNGAEPLWVTSIAVSPDGRLAASGHYDGTIPLWDLQEDQLRKTKNEQQARREIWRLMPGVVSYISSNGTRFVSLLKCEDKDSSRTLLLEAEGEPHSLAVRPSESWELR